MSSTPISLMAPSAAGAEDTAAAESASSLNSAIHYQRQLSQLLRSATQAAGDVLAAESPRTAAQGRRQQDDKLPHPMERTQLLRRPAATVDAGRHAAAPTGSASSPPQSLSLLVQLSEEASKEAHRYEDAHEVPQPPSLAQILLPIISPLGVAYTSPTAEPPGTGSRPTANVAAPAGLRLGGSALPVAIARNKLDNLDGNPAAAATAPPLPEAKQPPADPEPRLHQDLVPMLYVVPGRPVVLAVPAQPEGLEQGFAATSLAAAVDPSEPVARSPEPVRARVPGAPAPHRESREAAEAHPSGTTLASSARASDDARLPGAIPLTQPSQEDGRALIDKLANALLTKAGTNEQAFNVRLAPPGLGRVSVEITAVDGDLAARIEVQSDDTRRLVAANLPLLQEALARYQVALSRIEIEVAPSEDEHSSTGTEPDDKERSDGERAERPRRPNPPRNRHDPADAQRAIQRARRWLSVDRVDIEI